MVLISLYENDFLEDLYNTIYLKIRTFRIIKYAVGILNVLYLILSCTHIYQLFLKKELRQRKIRFLLKKSSTLAIIDLVLDFSFEKN